MGSRAGPKLLKTCLTWFRGGSFLLPVLFRLLGLPCALLALHLELHGTSTATTAFLLRRLRRRLLLFCMFRRKNINSHEDEDGGVKTFFFLGGADVMDRPTPATQASISNQEPPGPRRTWPTRPTLHNQALRSGAVVSSHASHTSHTSHTSPTIALTPPPPDPHPHPHQLFPLLREPSHPSATDPPSAAASTLPSPASLSLSAAAAAATSITMSSHSRSSSRVDVVKQGKRLSLQFPIQPAAGSNSPQPSPRSRPQSWIATPSPVPSPEALPSPTEDNFLAILAAQERYVLELREELAKAEADLKQVKKHWATHQTIKQRNDLRRVTQLQPLRNDLAGIRPDQDDEDGSTLWMQKEMERRKALLNGTRTSQRKVFSGSRHLRTLSLLSPDKPYAPSFPQPPDIRNSRDTPDTTQPTPTRSSTSSDRPPQPSANAKDERYDLTGLSAIQRDALLRTGKQMAADFKDGLLTFIEDIRQATVGEEAANNADPSASTAAQGTKGPRKSSHSRPPLNRASSSKKTEQSKDIAEDFWREHGLSEPKTAPTLKKTHPVKHNRTPQKQAKEEDFDEWDNWDTPNNDSSHDKAAQESDESDAPSSPVSGQASSRTSTRYHSQRHDSKASTHTPSSSVGLLEDAALRDGKRNSIPWPDLVKLSPTNLKRTASHLMKEWEKNLTPPPESRNASHASGDYIGRSASPAQLP